ncbi:hypothetical protein ACJIZ3_024748 [Penstemon smallii]|uniref:tRNA pseudouridine(55) synthase n=1 Tax=Penstemon smallii TaxID=265156 RepID=A0ABD3TVB2_9LAMI
MANNGAQVNVATEVVHDISAAEANSVDLKLLRDAVRTLPPQPLKDLLSNGVCPRCILRLFGLHDQIFSRPSVVTSVLSEILFELIEGEGYGANSSSKETKDLSNSASVSQFKEEFNVCSVCLGILQFVYNVDKGILVKRGCASDFAAAIGDVIKQEGHQIDSFSLELSLPPTVAENEQAIWSYMRRKYCSESWYQEKFPSESIATKDFLKLSVTNPLEMLLDVKSNSSSFRVRLAYTFSDALEKNQCIKESNGCYKRRKTDDSDEIKKYGDHHKIEGHDLAENTSIEPKDDRICSLKFPLEKYSRNVSQSRWIIDDERMGEASIEEIIGGNILPMCRGDSYKFHAAGREDIDVRMLGTGRPFLVEILNARRCPSDVLVKDMEIKINSLERKFVRVKNLKVLGSQAWDLMREGEAEKQKEYAALVWISRPLDNDDVEALSSLKELQILQKTPIRVLHRRSPLERPRTIHWMKIERIAGSSQYFLLHLCTQAGTYIKEFVHGDLGRTHPSVGSILKCRAEILQLDVTDVKMDCFQS